MKKFRLYGSLFLIVLMLLLPNVTAFETFFFLDKTEHISTNMIKDARIPRNEGIQEFHQNPSPVVSHQPPSWRIRTLNWFHINDAGTAVKFTGSLGLLYSMGLYDVGFKWGSFSHLNNWVDADDYGILNSFSAKIFNLNRKTTYSFKAVGTHIHTGVNYYGRVISFKPGEISLGTHDATNLHQNSARLNGELYHTGGATLCKVWFRYGTSSDHLTKKTREQDLTNAGTFSEVITDLVSEKKYYFQAVGSNDCGTVSGGIYNFTTMMYTDNTPPLPPEKPNGPSIGTPNTIYRFTTKTIDLENDTIRYGWVWGEDETIEWTTYYPSGNNCTRSHSWDNAGEFTIRVIAEDTHGQQSNFSEPFTVIITNPPDTPRISGSTRARIWKSHTYTARTTDPEQDQIYYLFDWDDGTKSDWLGPFSSGFEVAAAHNWNRWGTYTIKVKSKDEYNMESDWDIFEVKIRFI